MGLGKRSFRRKVSVLPCRFASTSSTLPQNSHRIWRQAPQGGVSVSVSATTATRRNWRAPSETALKTATRSAQSVRPYEAFSTLQPVWMRLAESSSAAPTWKWENGAWAFRRALSAASTSGSIMWGRLPACSGLSGRLAAAGQSFQLSILGSSARRNFTSVPRTILPVSSTSAWLIFCGRMPAAMLVTQEMPSARMPI